MASDPHPQTRPVRLASPEDVPDLTRIYVRAYAQPPWNEQNDPQQAERYLRWVMSQSETFCLVSLDDAGAIAGFVLTGARAYEEFVLDWERLAERPPEGWPRFEGKLGYIWEIAVDPAAQRRGHGTALTRAALEALRGLGVATVVLRSSERATAAVALYRRFGFERVALRERRDPLAGPWTVRL